MYIKKVVFISLFMNLVPIYTSQPNQLPTVDPSFSLFDSLRSYIRTKVAPTMAAGAITYGTYLYPEAAIGFLETSIKSAFNTLADEWTKRIISKKSTSGVPTPDSGYLTPESSLTPPIYTKNELLSLEEAYKIIKDWRTYEKAHFPKNYVSIIQQKMQAEGFGPDDKSLEAKKVFARLSPSVSRELDACTFEHTNNPPEPIEEEPLETLPQTSIKLALATLENNRGENGTAKYKNQDRACTYMIKEETTLEEPLVLAGVFDGHGEEFGGDIAGHVRALVEKYSISFFKENEITQAYEKMKNLGTIIQAELIRSHSKRALYNGTTACFGIINPLTKKVTLYNTGDSRAIIIRGKEVLFATTDHKPENEAERDRIARAKGIITKEGYATYDRSYHALAVTRTLGDLSLFLHTVTSAKADVTTHELQTGDIVLFASDGLWDTIGDNNEQVASMIQEDLGKGKLLENIAKKLTTTARTRKSFDDITVVMVQL